MNTWPVGTVNGSVPSPALTVVCPIRLSGPHVPRLACGSGHCFTEARSPINPGGRCNRTPLRTCSLSWRPIVVVNGVNAPAWMFVLPTVNDGENGSAPRHGPPANPEVTGKLDEDATGLVEDHDVNDAAVA